MDWASYAGGKRMFATGGLGCTHKNFMVVETNGGAGYMLYYSLLSFFYAISMWYIFFQIPKNYGMLKKFTRRDKMPDILDMSVRSSMKLGEDDVKTLVKELESDRKFNSKMFKQNSQIINGSHLEQSSTFVGTGDSKETHNRQRKNSESGSSSSSNNGLIGSGSGKSRPRKLSDNWINSNSNVPVTSHEKSDTDSMVRPNGSLVASIVENKGLP